MNNPFPERTRIQPVPVRDDRCYLCNEIRPCGHVDRDFRGASICGDVTAEGDCAHSVMLAELLMRKIAHCATPTDSILEDHS